MLELENVTALYQDNKTSFVEWQEPISFNNKVLPVFDTSVFPKWMQEYVEGVAEATQTPVDASAIACIFTLSTILSKNFEVNPVDGWIEPLNTYSVMALASANRKSSVFKSYAGIITEYEREQSEALINDIADQESLINAKKIRVSELERQYSKEKVEGVRGEIEEEIKSISREIKSEKIIRAPRFITADVTPETVAELMQCHNEKIAILSAEGGEAFEMMAGRYSKKSNIDIYLKGHSADYVAVDRMGRDSIVLFNPAMTIGLFVQPSIIRDMPKSFQERGLTQRFLYSFPKSTLGQRCIEPEIVSIEVKETFTSNINNMLKYLTENPIKLIFSEDASKYLIQLRGEIEEMLNCEDHSDAFKGWIGKLAGQIIRLAGLIHLADTVTSKVEDVPTVINKDVLIRANRLRNYFIKHAEQAHGVMDLTENIEDAKYVLKRISESLDGKELMDYRDLWQLLKRRFGKSENLKNVLVELEEMRYIRNELQGRKNIIRTNPLFFKSS